MSWITIENTSEHLGGKTVLNAFVMRYYNAKKAIKQINNGEWVPLWNSILRTHVTAHKDGRELWIGNGPFFCEIKSNTCCVYFGYIFRHWVYWAAARHLKTQADKKRRTMFKQELL